ncbi:hypothetical protein [Streptomyces shenzhenensis]|uniref:hypothetical protein n=1 Tax=Streptomyces shenzhenensis TaxID=943815 RepID=UPI0036891055
MSADSHALIAQAAKTLQLLSVEPIRIATAEHVRTTHGTWVAYVRCPYCHATHQHGAGIGEVPDGNGDRVPHCIDVYGRHMPQYSLMDPGYDDGEERKRAHMLLTEFQTEHRRLIAASRNDLRKFEREFSAEVRNMAKADRAEANATYLAAIRAAYGEAK